MNILDTSKLSKNILKRWVKDYDLPIKIFEEPYFSYLIDLYDNVLHTKDKLNLLIDIVSDFNNENDYLSHNNNVTDTIINTIQSQDAYKAFISMNMDKFNISSKYPKNSIYKEHNIGKTFLSIDLVKANFQSLKFIDKSLVLNCTNYDDLISQFTHYQYIQQSKYIRQVIFGHLNPKRLQKIQRYLIEEVILYILSHEHISEEFIIMASNDEVVFEINDSLSTYFSSNFKDIMTTIKETLNIDVDIEVFTLNHIGMDCYVKEFKNKEGYQFAGVSQIYYPQVYKKYHNLPITDMDLIFKHEHQLVKFLNPIF